MLMDLVAEVQEEEGQMVPVEGYLSRQAVGNTPPACGGTALLSTDRPCRSELKSVGEPADEAEEGRMGEGLCVLHVAWIGRVWEGEERVPVWKRTRFEWKVKKNEGKERRVALVSLQASGLVALGSKEWQNLMPMMNVSDGSVNSSAKTNW